MSSINAFNWNPSFS
uniref:Uncharacterized protein n=1 Tax=Lepeophtheirus salmonis TaxID=72036 RepID=A0A0K2VAB0_LEPSM